MSETGLSHRAAVPTEAEEEEQIRTAQEVPDRTPTQGPVSREELVDHLGSVFNGPAPTRDDLVSAAERSGARPDAIDLLRLLPAQRYHRPHDLWEHLPEVPIER